MQVSFWWWQCSDRYVISLSPHLHTPVSPSLISLMVSVDVKDHVYLLIYLRGEILHCTERLAVWLLFLHEHIAGKHTDQKTVLKYDFCFLSGQTVEKHTQNRDTTFKKKKGERKNILKNPDSREKHFGCWKCHNLAFLRIVNRKEYNLCFLLLLLFSSQFIKAYFEWQWCV